MGADLYDDGKILEGFLGPERTEDIRNQLMMSARPKDVAALIHTEWGCAEGRSLATVLTMVNRYRRTVTSKLIAKRVERTLGAHKHMKAMDAMGELTEIIRKQRLRVDKALKLEEKAGGMLLTQTGNELRLLKDLCKDLAAIQLETGVLQRAPKVVQGAFGGSDGKVISFTWTESDDALLGGLEAPTIEGFAQKAIEGPAEDQGD